MSSFTFSGEAFASAFASLGEKYALWGPKRLKGRGRFFGTDLITYAPLKSFDELETDEKSAMSPKSVVFPPDEMARPLGRDHDHIDIRRRDYLVVMNIEAVGKDERVAFFKAVEAELISSPDTELRFHSGEPT